MRVWARRTRSASLRHGPQRSRREELPETTELLITLAQASDEGQRSGLGWIAGRVRAFASLPEAAGLALPHMGWNDATPVADMPLFKGMGDDARFYFLHSFYFDCASLGNVAATARYGLDFSCAVRSGDSTGKPGGNIYGVQFHPEKSHHWGARLLQNFAEL